MNNREFFWPQSLWKSSAESISNFPSVESNLETDLLIIGAGYTGLSTAIHAKETHEDIVIIDQAQPGWGCSGRNGGQINPQWKPSIIQLRQKYSGDKFDRFIDALDQSADLVFDLIEKYNIQCQVIRTGSLIPGRGSKAHNYLSQWSQFWQQYGADVELLDTKASADVIGSSHYDYCMLDRRGGSLQPLSYSRGLVRACFESGVQVFGNTRANSINRKGRQWVVDANGIKITANKVVIATNGYTHNLWPGLKQTVIPVASMLTATAPLSDEIANQILPQRQPVAEFAGVPAYYRLDELNRMVFGWRGTLSGSIGNTDTTHLRQKAVRLFPQLSSVDWEYDWAGYVGVTSHQRPMLLKLAENAYAGLGFNGRGITMATMMGKQLAFALSGQRTSIDLKPIETVPFHPFYPFGVWARILTGHLNDVMTRRVK